MQPRPSYLYLTLTALLLALGLAAWLLSSAAELHDRFAQHSRGLGFAFLIVLIVLLAVATLWAGRLALDTRVTTEAGQAQAPDDMIQAAAVQAEHAEEVIRQVTDAVRQGRLEPGAERDPSRAEPPRVSRRRLRHRLGRQDVA